MEPELHRTATDYQCVADAHALRGPAPHFAFSGRSFTTARSRRDSEIAGRGCGITPRVWRQGNEKSRNSEVPTRSREEVCVSTTGLAQQAGITPRRRAPMPEAAVSKLRMEPTVWHQHDHERSGSDRKELREMRPAGLHSARIGWLRQPDQATRLGVNDRPDGMRLNAHEPGSWHYTPSDKNGDPTLFGRSRHFTSSFTCAPRNAG